MSAADARDQLEAEVWRVLGEYSAAPRVHHVDRILTLADRYRHAAAGEDDLAGRGWQPRLHWRGQLDAPGIACHLGYAGAGLPVAADPLRVTCAQCRRTSLWQDAAGRLELATAERTGSPA